MKHIIFTFQVCLMAMMSAFTAQAQTVIPYLPMQSSLGNTIELNAFTPSLNDFTLEVTGATSGTEISVGGDYVKYTPTANGTVRFAQYKGIVYVYENGEYIGTRTTSYSINYSTTNLLENPSFETNSSIGTDRWKDGVYWNVYDGDKAENWGTASPNSSIRNGSSYGTYRFLMHSNGRYLTQQLTAGKLKPNAYYKVQYYYAMSSGTGNNGGTYTLELGSTQFGTEYGAITAHTVPNSTAWAPFETAFTTGAAIDASQPAWFCLHRSNSKVDFLDDIQLYEGTLSVGSGITGATAATFLDGAAKAPEITLSDGDAFDMYPYYLVNPNFDANNAGWATTVGTLSYSTGAKGDGTLLAANDGKLQVWGIGAAGTVSQTISGLPNGKYNLKAAVYGTAITENGLFLFANLGQTVIPTSASTTNEYFEVNSVVTDGTLQLGLKVTDVTAGTFEVDLDKVSLLYYGPDYSAQAEALLAQIATYRDLFLQPQNAALKAAFAADTLAAYNAATASPLVPTNLENTAAALATRLPAVNASIAAYQTLGPFLDRVESYTLGYYTGFSGYETYSAAVTAARTAYTGGTIEDADIPTTIANLKTAESTCLFSDGATDQTTLITNPTFDTNINGWTSTTGASNNQRASNQYDDFSIPFWENWNDNAFTGKMYQTITNVPNGKYRLKAAVFTNTQKSPSDWIYLYANASKTPVTTTTPTYYMVDVEVVGGTLEVGIEISEAISQWVGVDNFTLYRLGDITSPLISIDKNAFSFNYRQTTKQFTVKAINLTADITFTPPTGITLSPANIPQNTENLGTEGVVVTATFDRSASITESNIAVTTTDGNTVNIAVTADNAFQANFLYGWDANGATGAGSEPNNYGWQSAFESVNWNVASAGNTGAYTYYRDGQTQSESKRALSKHTSSVDVAYPVLLETGKSYYFSGKWSWVADGESPYSSTFAVYDNAAGSGDAIASATNTSTGQSVVPSSFGFTAPATAVYWVVWKTTQGRCFAWDFSLVETHNYVIAANAEGTVEAYNTVGASDPSTYSNIVFNEGSTLTGIGDGDLTVRGVVEYQLTVAKERWYAIGFPFDIASVYSHYFATQEGWDPYLYPKGSTDQTNDYWLKTYDGSQFVENAEGIAAGTGYIIQFPEYQDGKNISFISAPSVTLTNSNSSLTADENYSLVNNPSLQALALSTSDNALYYRYSQGNNCFNLVEEETSINPFEAVIIIQKPSDPQSAPKQILIEDNFTTIEKPAISGNDPVTETRYYTLQGALVSQPAENGVYIVKNIRQSGQEEITKMVYLKK